MMISSASVCLHNKEIIKNFNFLIFSVITMILTLIGLLLSRMVSTISADSAGIQVLFDFSKSPNLNGWIESSDTVREVGKSKASLVLQKTQVFQRAILFTLLNPQPNGAAFAGVNYYSRWDLSSFDALKLRVRAQGENSIYKIVLRHRGEDYEPNPSYEATFPVTLGDDQDIVIRLSEFKPYYRGKPVEDAPALDKSSVSAFGIQVFGGVYQPKKQKGVSSLEIDLITAVQDSN